MHRPGSKLFSLPKMLVSTWETESVDNLRLDDSLVWCHRCRGESFNVSPQSVRPGVVIVAARPEILSCIPSLAGDDANSMDSQFCESKNPVYALNFDLQPNFWDPP